jgi:hypothetical protein
MASEGRGRRARSAKPPAGIASGPTLLHAIVPSSIRFVNRGRFVVDGKTFPGAPRLLVVRDMIQNDYDLLFCDDRWQIVAGTSDATLKGIKAEAERFYPGLTPHWVDLGIDEAKAQAYLERLRRRIGCSFCRRLPGQFASGNVFEVGRVRICGDCVTGFWQDLNETGRR